VVLDIGGAGIARFALVDVARPGVEACRTDENGAFDLEGSPEKLAPADPSWTLVRDTPPWTGPIDLRVLVVARSLRIAGIVQDPDGRPPSGANVSIVIPT